MKTTRVQLNCHGVNSEHSHEHTNILCLTTYVILENVKTRFLNFEKKRKIRILEHWFKTPKVPLLVRSADCGKQWIRKLKMIC